jgi:endogenous inhibitor of DNA gyrase (YacG/DUF329 family)
MKYSKCPICGKKGLYLRHSHFYKCEECRYCKSSWAVAKHRSTTIRATKKCPDCGEEGMEINGEWAVYPHFCRLSDSEIAAKIEKAKKRHELLKTK